MKRNIGSILGGLVAATLLLGASGCGLERILVVDLSGDPGVKTIPPPPLSGTALRGTYTFATTPTIRAIGSDGTDVAGAVITPKSDNTGYDVQFPAGDYHDLTVVATAGAVVLELLVPELLDTQQVTDANLDADSTALALVLQGLAGAHGNTFAQLRGPELTMPAMAALKTKLAASDAHLVALRDAVGRVIAAAAAGTGTDPSLQTPSLKMDFTTLTSAINPTWLATATVDLDGVGGNDTTSDPFDAILIAAVQDVTVCPDPDTLRVILATNFNNGMKDSNCATINRFNWVTDEPGKHMYFTGGAPYQTVAVPPEYLVEMGNWVPNLIPMYDDGTHGDQAAGDNIWTISFDLPKDMKFGYKYTWGKPADGWTHTEEWPGNQRLLIVRDFNDDGIVYRLDNFGDETTNKDIQNLKYGTWCARLATQTDSCKCAADGETRPACLARATCPTATVCGDDATWETLPRQTTNADAIPLAVENPIDLTNTCSTTRTWITPDWIGPVIKYCPL